MEGWREGGEGCNLVGRESTLPCGGDDAYEWGADGFLPGAVRVRFYEYFVRMDSMVLPGICNSSLNTNMVELYLSVQFLWYT